MNITTAKLMIQILCYIYQYSLFYYYVLSDCSEQEILSVLKRLTLLNKLNPQVFFLNYIFERRSEYLSASASICLNKNDIEKIYRFAKDYHNSGQNFMKKIMKNKSFDLNAYALWLFSLSEKTRS